MYELNVMAMIKAVIDDMNYEDFANTVQRTE